MYIYIYTYHTCTSIYMPFAFHPTSIAMYIYALFTVHGAFPELPQVQVAAVPHISGIPELPKAGNLRHGKTIPKSIGSSVPIVFRPFGNHCHVSKIPRFLM